MVWRQGGDIADELATCFATFVETHSDELADTVIVILFFLERISVRFNRCFRGLARLPEALNHSPLAFTRSVRWALHV